MVQRRQAFQVVTDYSKAGGAEMGDGVVHVLGVPDDQGVKREAERAELVFLAFAVGLAQLASVAVVLRRGRRSGAPRGG